MLCGWEGNRRSGVALAMRHKHTGKLIATHGLTVIKDCAYSCYAVLRIGSHITHYSRPSLCQSVLFLP